MAAVTEHAPRLGVRALCAALGAAPATYYRRRRPAAPQAPRAQPPRALVPAERQRVLAALHAPRFVDLAPAQVYATLLDEGTSLGSERTMYQAVPVLAAEDEVRERRAPRRHPTYAAPELAGSHRWPRRRTSAGAGTSRS